MRFGFPHHRSIFVVQLPRFYPSQPPCVSVEGFAHGLPRPPCIDESSRLSIPLLQHEWNAVRTMRDVFCAAERVSWALGTLEAAKMLSAVDPQAAEQVAKAELILRMHPESVANSMRSAIGVRCWKGLQDGDGRLEKCGQAKLNPTRADLCYNSPVAQCTTHLPECSRHGAGTCGIASCAMHTGAKVGDNMTEQRNEQETQCPMRAYQSGGYDADADCAAECEAADLEADLEDTCVDNSSDDMLQD